MINICKIIVGVNQELASSLSYHLHEGKGILPESKSWTMETHEKKVFPPSHPPASHSV